MSQLKMYWMAGTPIAKLALPEGYSFSNYKDEADKAAWIECCKQGLIADDADEEVFNARIERHNFVNMYTDVIFLDYKGEHIGTVTAVHHTDDNTGEVHMVGIRPDFRGRGLGKYVNNAAIIKLNSEGVGFIELTTDEWRKGAVKSYLSSGFLPVLYDTGMKERWEAVLTEYGIDSVDMVCEDGKYCCTLYRKGYTPKKIKIGVVGAGRGKTMMDYCTKFDDAELVAICDSFEPALEGVKQLYGEENITYYSDFDKFILHDMDAVVLANFANDHAPYAVRCLEHGLNVMSEVLPVQTMKEAVELIEAVEKSGKVYAYAENYCYMPALRKMRLLYRDGVLGKFEYGEGEYMHDCEAGWHRYTRGEPQHWRNTMDAFYYCTHSIGPLVHITGLRPVKVAGFEGPFNARMKRMGAKAGNMGIEIITLENGALLKSIHGVGPSKDSIWYSIYGSKGRMESSREDAGNGGVRTLYVNCDENEGDNKSTVVNTPTDDEYSFKAGDAGHGGSDFYTMFKFVQKLNGKDTDTVDIYEALDMFLPGLFAYRSALSGGITLDIPDLRDKKEREKWRNDTQCTDPEKAGDMLVPSYSKGNPDIPAENYEKLKIKLQEKSE